MREVALIVQARGGGRVGWRAACAGRWARCGGEGGRTCRRGGRGLQEAQVSGPGNRGAGGEERRVGCAVGDLGFRSRHH